MQTWSSSDTGSSNRWRSLAITIVIVACAIMVWFARCESDNAPADLQQAASLIRWQLRPRNLARSTFPATFPNGQPSDWIDFQYSSLGTAERTNSEEEAGKDPRIREQARAIRMPLLPKGIRIVPWKVDKQGGRQIVLSSDNAGGKVIVEGYTDPTQSPVMKRTYTLPKVTYDPGTSEAVKAAEEPPSALD